MTRVLEHPITIPDQTAPIPDARTAQLPETEVQPDHLLWPPHVGKLVLPETVETPDIDIATEISKGLAGDEDSREAVNKYLENASPKELLDPDVRSLLELSGVRKRYLFPAVARIMEKSQYTGAMQPEEQQLVKKTFDLLGFAPHQAREIWKTWHSYNVKYRAADRRSGSIPEDKKVGDINPAKVTAFGKTVTRNFNRIEEVNGQDPNAVQTLFKRDHIRNFARYDLSSLVGQAQPSARVDQLVVSMADDHNGAANNSLAESVAALDMNPGKPKARRFVEAATGSEARQLLDNVAAETGPATDIVFVVHASPDSIHFSDRAGGAVTREEITGTDEKPPLFDNTIISRGAHVMVLGCESGVKNGIAAIIGKQLHVRARSPDIKSFGLERSYLGRLKSKSHEGKSQALPVYGINPVRALAARIRTTRKWRNRDTNVRT